MTSEQRDAEIRTLEIKQAELERRIAYVELRLGITAIRKQEPPQHDST